MTVRFRDPGGEYYFSSGMTAPGIWTNHGAALTSSAPAGRATQYAVTVGGSGNGFEAALGAGYTTLIVGVAIYIPASWLPPTVATPIIILQDSGTFQCDVRINPSGQIIVTRNGTQLGSASTNAIVNGSGWHYFEAQFTINSATGSVQVWVDNVSWLTVSGQNTQNTANNTANQVRFYQGGNAQPNSQWKDMYVLDTGTGGNTTRLGDITVYVKFANSAGPSQQWTNNGGASQTASVQDGITHTGTWPDGDTTYISDSVSGHISDFHPESLGAGTIFEVCHVSYVRSDAGASNFQQYSSSGTVHTTANIAVGASYNYYFDGQETDPNTSAQWTVTNFNNATFGVKIP